MNISQSELVLMADASGISMFAMGMDREEFLRRLNAFAKLVERRILSMDNPHLRIALDAAQDKARKDEREACAKVCEEAHWSLDDREEYAAAIRARGEA